MNLCRSYIFCLASKSCSLLLYSILLNSNSKTKNGGKLVKEENIRAAKKRKTEEKSKK